MSEDERNSVVLSRSEWNALVVQSVLSSGAAGAIVTMVGLKLGTPTPDSVWFALGVLTIGLMLLPLNLASSRLHGHRASVGRTAAWIVAGCVVGGLLHFFLQSVG